MEKISAIAKSHTQQSVGKWKDIILIAWGVALILTGVLVKLPWQQVVYATARGDWPTYLDNSGRQGFNVAETVINPSSASHLKLHWTAGGGVIFSQPVEANGRIYWGSFDGYEHATGLNGGQVWKQYLGQTRPNCDSNVPLGVVSTATIASVSIKGTMTPVVFVGGGDTKFYALNAATGTVIWKTSLGARSSNRFIWSSPAVYNGSAYIGIASIGDCPLVQGQIFQMSLTTGAIQHTFNVVPDGCVGGGVWGSPTIDAGTNALYFATGNGGKCSMKEPYTIAVVKLRASDLTFLSSWQVPQSERTSDSDFGSTPTLFQAVIHGTMQSLIGVANKNGKYYAFDTRAISNGPVWRATIAVGGASPEGGDGSISPSAWDGSKLYVAGGKTTINGDRCKGSLRALNPATGAFIWQDCMKNGSILGAVSLVPGVAAVVEGADLVLVTTTSGKTLFTNHGSTPGSHFYGAASISHGVLYIGNKDKKLYAFGT
jgi:outer membrane protein assembly factor BamB